MKVVIYGAEWCTFCQKAKSLAENIECDLTYKDVKDTMNQVEFRDQFPTEKKIPQILINGRHVGGYDQFAEEVQNIQDSRLGQGPC